MPGSGKRCPAYFLPLISPGIYIANAFGFDEAQPFPSPWELP